MTLIEFLIARIADDEGVAEIAGSGDWGTASLMGSRAVVGSGILAALALDMASSAVIARCDEVSDAMPVERHIARWDPARVLAECKTKRWIVHEHRDDGEGGCLGCGFGSDEERMNSVDECPTLRALAWPYADHPDFDEAWGPA